MRGGGVFHVIVGFMKAHVLVPFSCCNQHCGQEECGRRELFKFTVYCPSLRKAGAGAQGRQGGGDRGGPPLTGLFPVLNDFSFTALAHLPRGDGTHGELCPSALFSNKKNISQKGTHRQS